MDTHAHPAPLRSRRGLLARPAALIATVADLDPVRQRARADPFTLGVGAGDADHRSVVLRTRLAPHATGPAPVPVEWEVYGDERLRRPVARGRTHARPEDGHAVHVPVGALRPDRWYWFRFRTGRHVSPVGRTRTSPAPASVP